MKTYLDVLNVVLAGTHEINETLRDNTRQLEAENAALQAENTRLRAAMAQSELPCVYCSLPRDEWAKCPVGFPGCARGDDAMGCPELGARLRAEQLEAENERFRAGIKSVGKLIDNSHGVYGLHLNGDLSPWDELLAGGSFEEWLFDFSAALEQSVPRGTS